MPLRRAARAAYTRPDMPVPFEQRPLARQTYWIRAIRRALAAALDVGELAKVITTHSQYDYDPDTGLYRCTACGNYLARGWADHIATAIRAHFLGHEPHASAGRGDDTPSTSSQRVFRGGAPDGGTRR